MWLRSRARRGRRSRPPRSARAAVDEGSWAMHIAPEVPRQPGDEGADPAGADDTDGLAGEVEADESVEGEVAVAHTVVRLVDAAVQREDQRDRVLGNCVRRVRRTRTTSSPAGRRRPGRRCCTRRSAVRRGAPPPPPSAVEGRHHRSTSFTNTQTASRAGGEWDRRQPQPVLELDDHMAGSVRWRGGTPPTRTAWSSTWRLASAKHPSAGVWY